MGYPVYAQVSGNPAYLDPNRNSMQKPIGGLLDNASPENYIVPLYKGV
jgi:hypothetical protein